MCLVDWFILEAHNGGMKKGEGDSYITQSPAALSKDLGPELKSLTFAIWS